eukprot:COSAG05_NODE_57_length_23291_cov_75.862668_47_plen_186_part_00
MFNEVSGSEYLARQAKRVLQEKQAAHERMLADKDAAYTMLEGKVRHALRPADLNSLLMKTRDEKKKMKKRAWKLYVNLSRACFLVGLAPLYVYLGAVQVARLQARIAELERELSALKEHALADALQLQKLRVRDTNTRQQCIHARIECVAKTQPCMVASAHPSESLRAVQAENKDHCAQVQTRAL